MTQIERIEMDLYSSMDCKYLLKLTSEDVQRFEEEFFTTIDFIRIYLDKEYFRHIIGKTWLFSQTIRIVWTISKTW